MLLLAAMPARFTVFTCEGEVTEDAELVDALELEVRRTTGAVTRCGDQWRFESEMFEPVVVNLSNTPAHLRARTFALAVQTALRPATPRPVLGAPLVSPVTLLPPRPPPAPPPAPAVSPAQLQVDLGVRLFLLAPPTGLGGFLARAMTRWRFWAGFELGLTNVVAAQGTVRSFVFLGLLGARVFEVPLKEWSLVGDIAAEVGVLTTSTSASSFEYRGNNFMAVMFGGWALFGVQRIVGDELAIQVALRAGYDSGMRVDLIGVPTLNLNGPFVGLQLGFRL